MARNPYLMLVTGSALLASLSLAGCAGAPSVVKSGDNVGVSFTCRQGNGDIAVSTRTDAGKGAGEHLSPLFLPRQETATVVLSAGTPDPLPETKVRPMEEDVLQQLRGRVIGMKQGETRAVELHAMKRPGSGPRDGIVKFNRIFKYGKEERVTVADFKEQNGGKEPVAGEPCLSSTHRGLEGTVASVDNGEVLIRYSPQPGTQIPFFFGTGTVTDAGDSYEMKIDSEEGRLVRGGYVSGRVVQITSQTIAVDFGDQYGGETLNCALTVDSVQPGAPPAASTAEKVAASAAGNKE